MIETNCKNCGGPFKPRATVCEYCDSINPAGVREDAFNQAMDLTGQVIRGWVPTKPQTAPGVLMPPPYQPVDIFGLPPSVVMYGALLAALLRR